MVCVQNWYTESAVLSSNKVSLRSHEVFAMEKGKVYLNFNTPGSIQINNFRLVW